MIVRRDLSPESQACQAIHAARASAKAFPFGDEPHLCLCTVRDQFRLERELEKLRAAGIRMAEWREPDQNHELTAIASEEISGQHRRFFRNFQLFRAEKGEAVTISG